jgi:hypothetical protein
MRSFVTVAALAVSLMLGVTVVASPAGAAGSGQQDVPAGCYEKVTTDTEGVVKTEIVCPGQRPGEEPGTTVPVSGKERACYYQGKKISCTHGDAVWDGRCYVSQVPESQWPAKDDPVWQGHEDGVIVECLPYPCIQRPDQDNADCGASLAWRPGLPEQGPDPEVLAMRAIDQMQLQPIDIGIVPDDEPGAIGAVGLPVWAWVREPAPATYGPIDAEASAGGITVRAKARVQRVVWDFGDGTVLTCEGPGSPYEDRFGIADSPDCGHRYEKQGDPYEVTATSYWAVEWTGGGQSGTIPLDLTATTRIRVGEYQVLNQ